MHAYWTSWDTPENVKVFYDLNWARNRLTLKYIYSASNKCFTQEAENNTKNKDSNQ